MTTPVPSDNIVLPGFLAGLRVRARGHAWSGAHGAHGIAELATSGVTEVSGGQLQRAGICRAPINDPGRSPTNLARSAQLRHALQILDY